MQTFSRVLMLTGDDNGEPLPEKVLTALTPRFSLGAAGRACTARQTWLDTFDWRLHRAGLTAAHVTSTRPAELVLTGPAGEQVSQQAGRLRWPALPAVLPAGPVTGMLQEIAGIRALLPAAHTVTAEQELRILNPDAKTVAWVTLQRTAVTSPAAAQLPVRLEVTAVRGYQVQAERIAQILAAVPGVSEPTLAPLDAALAAAGRHPEDYSNKLSVPLVPDQPARLALRVLLLILLDTLQANVPGTIRGTDTEFLHDLRVSVRRTRSALKLVGNVLPGGLASRFAAEFKWLGDLTTPTRDLDVYLLNYQAITAGLVAADAGRAGAVPRAPGPPPRRGTAAPGPRPALGAFHRAVPRMAVSPYRAQRPPGRGRADRGGRRRPALPRSPPGAAPGPGDHPGLASGAPA